MHYRALVARIRLRTALHVGSGESNDTSDALCTRASDGEWIIPGTTLAGVLRSCAVRLAPRIMTEHHPQDPCRGLSGITIDDEPCRCIVCSLFGYRYLGSAETDANRPKSSRILISNALAEPSSQHTRIRDSIGIARTNATAAHAAGAKFDFEIVPAGTYFTFRIEFPLNEDVCLRCDEQDRLLAAVLAEWQAGRETLGGRSARGLGAITLDCLQTIDEDLKDNDSLIKYLDSDEPWLEETWVNNSKTGEGDWLKTHLQKARDLRCPAPKDPTGLVASRFVVFNCDIRACGSLLVNDPTVAGASGFDFAPVLEQLQCGAKPLLPGSSIRGVLRSQAEKIARSIASFKAKNMVEFTKQCPACDSLQSNPAAPLPSCETLLKKKMNTDPAFNQDQVDEQHLCLACQVFGSVHGASRIRVEDAPLSGGDFMPMPQDFLAIDRFTGGGLNGAKFDAVSAWQPRFRLRIQMANPEPWQLGWMALALRDIHDGMVPVGFGSAQGFGRVTLEDFGVDFGVIGDADYPTDSKLLRDKLQRKDSGLYHVTTLDEAEWLECAAPWVSAVNGKLSKYRRQHQLTASSDSYFNVTAEHSIPLSLLYPAEPAL